MKLTSFVVTTTFPGTYIVYGGNSPSDAESARYRTHGNLSRANVAAIIRKIADATDNDALFVDVDVVNDKWITG